MGIFSKPEIIIFKESNSAEEHLAKLEELLPRATGKVKENIQNQWKEDLEYDQMSLVEYIDPFTGEPVKKNKK